MIAGGVAAALGGLAITVIGVRKVPSSCSLTTNHCDAPPGDPAFDQARRGTVLVDVGLAVGAVGVAAIGGGLAWYYLKAQPERSADRKVVTPIVTPGGLGLALGGRF